MAKVKSQLERGSKSHRASVHTCGHPQEKRPMFGQIHVSQRCCVTSLLIHPHQETFCAALQRTARTWAHLELSQQGHDISSALFYQVAHEQRGRVRSGRVEAFQGQRKGSASLSCLSRPVPLEWQGGDSPCPVCAPGNNTRAQSLAFSTASRFSCPKQPSVLLPYE